jgi:hypothetical protein
VNPDELTADDLFRPEPSGPAGQAQAFQQQGPYQGQPFQPPEPYHQPGAYHQPGQYHQPEPYQQPVAYQQPAHHQVPPGQGEPWQGQWGTPPQQPAPAQQGGADETQVMAYPGHGGADGGADETQVMAYPGPDSADGGVDETRQLPQIPASFPHVPPHPSTPPPMPAHPSTPPPMPPRPPAQPPMPDRPPAPPQTPPASHRAPRQDLTRAQRRAQGGGHAAPAGDPHDPQDAEGSPFPIRPGLPAGAYGEEPSYAPGAEDGGSSEETRLLPPIAADGGPPAGPAPEADAERTQLLAPQGAGRWPTAPGSADYQQPTAAFPPPAPGVPPRPAAYAGHPDGPGDQGPPPRSRRAGSGGGRRLSPAAIVGIVVGLCAVAGLTAGAVLSGGGGGGSSDDHSQNASSSSQAPSTAPARDPAKAQAQALDKLLKDSNTNRSAVIQAVGSIRTCDNLSQSAQSLRDAAGHRNDLVSRLSRLSVDKLPDHAALTSALNRAWASSASADNHYAQWADQVAGRHGCHKGHARVTRELQLGDRASGDATHAKQEAVGLWNAIARKYGLTVRQSTQL